MAVPPEPQITVIKLTPDELQAKKLGTYNLQASLEALHRDGIVALENAVDVAHLDKLNARMVPEARKIYKESNTQRNFGNHTGNIQQEPFLEEEYMFEDVVVNPWATQVVQCMLGPATTIRFYSANTAFKATGRQPPHIDVTFEFPKMPFGYCININLVDTTPENGSTEIWLGSHTDTDRSVLDSADGKYIMKIRDELQEERLKTRPPIQPSLPKGSLIIRDLRLWHAGKPNTTDEPRVMLVTAQFPQWYRSDLTLKLPVSLKGKVDFGDTAPCVEWVPDDFDFMRAAPERDFVLLP